MADKQIVQKPVTVDQLIRFAVELTIGDASVLATYFVVDSTGAPIGDAFRVVTIALTEPDKNSLMGFVNSVVLPGINDAEGT